MQFYNFDSLYSGNSQSDTDYAIACLANQITEKYKIFLKQKYPIIIQNNHDIYSYLAFSVLKNLLPLSTIKPELLLYGDLLENEKSIFKNTKPISPRKVKKVKKAIYVNGFNPLLNVEVENNLSNCFKLSFFPLEKFAPYQLSQLQAYYLDKSLWQQFSYNGLTFALDDLKNLLPVPPGIKLDNPIYYFHLQGKDSDFPLYDKILAINEDEPNSLFLYTVDNMDFVKVNLSYLLPPYKRPFFLSLVDEEEKQQLNELKVIIKK